MNQEEWVEQESFVASAWTRLAFEGTPVYVRDCDPCWFVPNAAGDRLLQAMMAGAEPNGDVNAARFLARLPPGGADRLCWAGGGSWRGAASGIMVASYRPLQYGL